MDDLTKILITIFGSFVVFVAGQVFVRFFVDPVLEVRKLIGEIAFTLTLYANVCTSPREPDESDEMRDRRSEAARAYREQSGQLRGRTYAVIWHGLAERVHLLPPRGRLYGAAERLVGLSNNCYRGEVDLGLEYREKIEAALGLARGKPIGPSDLPRELSRRPWWRLWR
jgi:hypothetical protein